MMARWPLLALMLLHSLPRVEAAIEFDLANDVSISLNLLQVQAQAHNSDGGVGQATNHSTPIGHITGTSIHHPTLHQVHPRQVLQPKSSMFRMLEQNGVSQGAEDGIAVIVPGLGDYERAQLVLQNIAWLKAQNVPFECTIYVYLSADDFPLVEKARKAFFRPPFGLSEETLGGDAKLLAQAAQGAINRGLCQKHVSSLAKKGKLSELQGLSAGTPPTVADAVMGEPLAEPQSVPEHAMEVDESAMVPQPVAEPVSDEPLHVPQPLAEPAKEDTDTPTGLKIRRLPVPHAMAEAIRNAKTTFGDGRCGNPTRTLHAEEPACKFCSRGKHTCAWQYRRNKTKRCVSGAVCSACFTAGTILGCGTNKDLVKAVHGLWELFLQQSSIVHEYRIKLGQDTCGCSQCIEAQSAS